MLAHDRSGSQLSTVLITNKVINLWQEINRYKAIVRSEYFLLSQNSKFQEKTLQTAKQVSSLGPNQARS